MRAFVPAYQSRVPQGLDSALELMEQEPGCWQVLAGGTDLMVLLNAGKLEQRQFINIWQLRELRTITVEEDSLNLGALTTYSDILRHEVILAEFPLLAAAAAQTGTVATQNRGTLGGNIMNASPAADSLPALLVYNAEVELTSFSRGARWVNYCDFHIGYKRTLIETSELLTHIRLPRTSSRWRSRYRKVGARNAQAISKVSFAGLHDQSTGETRIAFGSVAPVPLRCFRTEVAIRQGEAAMAALAMELAPIDDIRSSAQYRLRVAQNLLTEFLRDA